MPSITALIRDIDERTMAQRIGIPHDEARMRYTTSSNTVRDFAEFEHVIGDYFGQHFSQCVTTGGSLPRSEAVSRAKRLLEQAYRRRRGTIVTAFNDAHDGTNGGLRAILDIIADSLKAESLENYIRDAFDRHVAPNSWEDKVELIRQFMAQCGSYLASSIRTDQPERYAGDYEELIRSYVQTLEQTSSLFRRL